MHETNLVYAQAFTTYTGAVPGVDLEFYINEK
jgi:hypothetical protein